MRKDLEKYTITLAHLLLKSTFVEKSRIHDILEQHLATGIPFHELLFNSGTLTEEQLARILSFTLKTPVLRLSNCLVEESVLELFDPEFLLNHRILPFRSCAGVLLVLLTIPLLPQALQEIELISKRRPFFYFGLYTEITTYLSFYYQKMKHIHDALVADPWGIIPDDTLVNKLIPKHPPSHS